MKRIMNYPYIKNLDFAVAENGYITLDDITYKGITVPKGYLFDGVTVKAPFTFLFSQKNLRNGIRASCFHDWMCEHKSEFKRRTATKVLCEIWVEDGLGEIKACVVYLMVELFQIIKRWK